MPRPPNPAPHLRQGLWLGLLGVAIFALTLPMTRLATGTPDAPQLSGLFIALGRAAVAAALSAVLLLVMRAPWPTAEDWRALVLVALGVVFGFPLCTSLAMRHVEAVHASVILGVLPLATAAVGAWLHRQQPSAGFWLFAVVGAALVMVFAMLRSGASSLTLQAADLLLLAGMLCAAVGYGFGARLANRMPAEHVICWALLLALPVTLPLTLWTWPATPVRPAAWGGFAYMALFSMWLGFFAWYRGLSLGGTVRVSQLQLLQPFLSMLFAVPLLGETLDVMTLGFGLAVMVVVFAGRKMPVSAARHHPLDQEGTTP
ncbi:DMT family transporter [Curvibacter delicatus]|jgi:drug/metabolite transporter (DMT)-like permease|uniref:DMT family transporter n=1 Tax=Curvibacter delicatus TaxID=80879 RepID=UPI00082DA2D3|nr:DMT family transporter [Curvibacter delicatus]